MARSLPLSSLDDSMDVQLVFDPENYGGSWAIDDVYVDPYARGMTCRPARPERGLGPAAGSSRPMMP